MTESPYALAHDFALMVPAPDGVDAAIAEVMSRHEAELDEALRPYGVALVDLLQPTWMRAVRVGDVEALRSPGAGLLVMPDEDAPLGDAEADATFADALVDEMSRPLLPLASDRPAGGCCGSGEACSSAACTGAPHDGFTSDGHATTETSAFIEAIADRARDEARDV